MKRRTDDGYHFDGELKTAFGAVPLPPDAVRYEDGKPLSALRGCADDLPASPAAPRPAI
jgi:hypothetical protein